jgi:hypothetical protein
MKKNNKLSIMILCSFMSFVNHNALSAESPSHSHCKKIGDFCHNHRSGTACLSHDEKLSTEKLSHFINRHLGTDIYKLDMSSQKYLDSNILKELAGSERASAIKYLDLMSTDAGYCGIVALWKSSTFGSFVSESPTYEEYTGTPLVTIEIEIGHTKLYEQYKKKLFNYPLPFLKDFDITYGHRCVGKAWKRTGFKKIILLDHGTELKESKKKPIKKTEEK